MARHEDETGALKASRLHCTALRDTARRADENIVFSAQHSYIFRQCRSVPFSSRAHPATSAWRWETLLRQSSPSARVSSLSLGWPEQVPGEPLK